MVSQQSNRGAWGQCQGRSGFVRSTGSACDHVKEPIQGVENSVDEESGFSADFDAGDIAPVFQLGFGRGDPFSAQRLIFWICFNQTKIESSQDLFSVLPWLRGQLPPDQPFQPIV